MDLAILGASPRGGSGVSFRALGIRSLVVAFEDAVGRRDAGGIGLEKVSAGVDGVCCNFSSSILAELS